VAKTFEIHVVKDMAYLRRARRQSAL